MKKFTKSDLQIGDVIVYERKIARVVDEKDLSFINENYADMLKSPRGKLDIIAVYRNPIWKREELTITSDEKTILRNIDPKYKYIARDYYGKLYVYSKEPEKREYAWIAPNYMGSLSAINYLFKMVKWEDEEPWLIEDLLNLPVKEKKE